MTRFSFRSLSRAILGLGLLTTVIALLGAAGFTLYLWQTKILPAKKAYAQMISSHLQDHVQDQRLISSISWLKPKGQEHDAGPYLNPLMTWIGPKPGNFRALDDALMRYRAQAKSQFGPAIELSQPLRQQLQSWDRAFIHHSKEVDFSQVPLDWMSQLSRYDHWDVLTTGPLGFADIQPNDPVLFQVGWSIPLPDFKEFTHLARLRLMKAVHTGDLILAIHDLHELARLLLTTNTLFGNLTAVGILKAEQDAYTGLTESGKQVPLNWKPLSEDHLHRLRRTLMGFPSFIHPWVSKELLDSLQSQATIGFCAALTESLASALFYRPLTISSYADYYQWLDQEIANTPRCRLQSLKRIWDFGPVQETTFWGNALTLTDPVSGKSAGIPFFSFFAHHLSPLRRLIGEWYLAINVPSYLDLAYRQRWE